MRVLGSHRFLVIFSIMLLGTRVYCSDLEKVNHNSFDSVLESCVINQEEKESIILRNDWIGGAVSVYLDNREMVEQAQVKFDTFYDWKLLKFHSNVIQGMSGNISGVIDYLRKEDRSISTAAGTVSSVGDDFSLGKYQSRSLAIKFILSSNYPELLKAYMVSSHLFKINIQVRSKKDRDYLKNTLATLWDGSEAEKFSVLLYEMYCSLGGSKPFGTSRLGSDLSLEDERVIEFQKVILEL